MMLKEKIYFLIKRGKTQDKIHTRWFVQIWLQKDFRIKIQIQKKYLKKRLFDDYSIERKILESWIGICFLLAVYERSKIGQKNNWGNFGLKSEQDRGNSE